MREIRCANVHRVLVPLLYSKWLLYNQVSENLCLKKVHNRNTGLTAMNQQTTVTWFWSVIRFQCLSLAGQHGGVEKRLVDARLLWNNGIEVWSTLQEIFPSKLSTNPSYLTGITSTALPVLNNRQSLLIVHVHRGPYSICRLNIYIPFPI